MLLIKYMSCLIDNMNKSFSMDHDISKQWRDECQHIKIMSLPFQLSNIKSQIEERLPATQFKILQYMTQTQKHIQKLYSHPGHFAFNRYQAIMAFDNNRIRLGENQQKNEPQNYINANLIQFSGYQTIATQGPKYNTVINFWRMIEEQKVQSIFMLCERIQKQKQKCHIYWPIENQTLQIGVFQISVKNIEKINNIKIRHLVIKNIQNKTQREVIQYQFLGWPDQERPLPEQKEMISELLNIFIWNLEAKKMTVVHCSAGVGRTGAFIALASIRIAVRSKQQTFSVFECVRRLRQQRWGMVYTINQYLYLYEFIQQQIKKHSCQLTLDSPELTKSQQKSSLKSF